MTKTVTLTMIPVALISFLMGGFLIGYVQTSSAWQGNGGYGTMGGGHMMRGAFDIDDEFRRTGSMTGYGRGGGLMGQVTTVDGNTLTVKVQNGGTYTVDARKATITKVSEGSLSDISKDDWIRVHGTYDKDKLTATGIVTDIQAPSF